MDVQPADDGVEFFVRSRARGRVAIGTLPAAMVRAEMAQVVPPSREQVAATGTEALTEQPLVVYVGRPS
jgi:hypothetical protein